MRNQSIDDPTPAGGGTEQSGTVSATTAVPPSDGARWQFWALVIGSAGFAIAAATLPAFDDFLGDDGWSYQTLVDGRARFVVTTLLAPVALLALAAGLPLLRRYATARGRGAVTVGLGLLGAGTALFALALASDMGLAIAAKAEIDPAAGEAFVDVFQSGDAWERDPFFVGGLLFGIVGWVVFVGGARRARTITTTMLIVLLVIGVAWRFFPPGWALTVSSVAMTAAFAWLGRRVLHGPAPAMVTPPADGNRTA